MNNVFSLKTKVIFIGFALAMLLSFCFPHNGNAAEPQYKTWNAIAAEMVDRLNRSYDAYLRKDPDEAKKLVNEAYFGFYEKHGFERSVMAYISGKRGAHVEYQFPMLKKMIMSGASNKEVRTQVDYIIKMLREDANQLDGKEDTAFAAFFASLAIILREGLEAILVIAAMVAYLARSGNRRHVRTVYCSAGAAVAASVAAAYAMQKIFAVSGADQEIIEGISMLLAAVVLFFVSNWMFSKAEAEAWKGYIEGKMQSAVETGSGFALGAAAFLAVFREGAETILFYQAMLASETNTGMVWAGFGVGCVGLVIIFMVIRFGTMRLPLKPFFLGTSLLMYVMAIAFAGGGMRELQEGDKMSVTPVSFFSSSVDILGIHPTVETLLPQVLLVLLAVGSIVYYMMRSRAAKG